MRGHLINFIFNNFSSINATKSNRISFSWVPVCIFDSKELWHVMPLLWILIVDKMHKILLKGHDCILSVIDKRAIFMISVYTCLIMLLLMHTYFLLINVALKLYFNMMWYKQTTSYTVLIISFDWMHNNNFKRNSVH